MMQSLCSKHCWRKCRNEAWAWRPRRGRYRYEREVFLAVHHTTQHWQPVFHPEFRSCRAGGRTFFTEFGFGAWRSRVMISSVVCLNALAPRCFCRQTDSRRRDMTKTSARESGFVAFAALNLSGL